MAAYVSLLIVVLLMGTLIGAYLERKRLKKSFQEVDDQRRYVEAKTQAIENLPNARIRRELGQALDEKDQAERRLNMFMRNESLFLEPDSVQSQIRVALARDLYSLLLLVSRELRKSDERFVAVQPTPGLIERVTGVFRNEIHRRERELREAAESYANSANELRAEQIRFSAFIEKYQRVTGGESG